MAEDSRPASNVGAGLEAPVRFEAVLRPHRSLSPAGFVIVMAVLAGFSFTAGAVFLALGAWPVFGFFGLDVALVYLAFRLNYRAGTGFEHLRLTEQALTVERVTPSGRSRRWSFPAGWVQVLIDDRNGASGSARLALRAHGREVVLGAFLTPGERRDLAAALRAALVRLRSGRGTLDFG